MKRFIFLFLLLVLLAACTQVPAPTITPSPMPSATSTLTAVPTPTSLPPTATLAPTLTPTSGPQALVPNFDHIVMITFENKEFGSVIGSPLMPNYNKLAHEYTLLTQYYAIRHPSLPNYLALMGGDTFGVDSDCRKCFVNEPSLPDLIEASGRTWKAYQEDMPQPCYLGDTNLYVQKHNPFVYFDPIRLNPQRCEQAIVPLTTLETDIEAGTLPNFVYITPNICNDSHNCSLDVADAWLTNQLATLIPALDASGDSYLIVMMFEEGQGNHTCCGLPEPGGGRVPVVLYSPLVKTGFEDATPYTHYSLLKTISAAWGLKYLGHAADDTNALITAPWK
ncbi:MAG TPA: alkaline phosphatase family protein [Anaerolineales bacterium]|nr:alkaline phosphatase family protein [Anaerolineales bacterium]